MDFWNKQEEKTVGNTPTPDEIKETFGNFFKTVSENGKKIFLCRNCVHKNVCKKINDEEEQCSDFMNGGTYKVYGNIYDMFQPIFDWLKFHYPHGEVKFVVDGSSAQMYQEHGAYVVSKELKRPLGEIIGDFAKEQESGE